MTLRPTVLTFSDDSLKADDVGVIELAHDAGLAQEIPSLLLRVSSFQGFDGHADLSFPWRLQAPTTYFAELTCDTCHNGLHNRATIRWFFKDRGVFRGRLFFLQQIKRLEHCEI